MTGVCAQC